MIADIRPNEEHAAECVPKNPMVTVTQCVPEMSEHEVNTVAVMYANKAISHVEGGWPKDVDCTEAEHTIRWVLLVLCAGAFWPCHLLALTALRAGIHFNIHCIILQQPQKAAAESVHLGIQHASMHPLPCMYQVSEESGEG